MSEIKQQNCSIEDTSNEIHTDDEADNEKIIKQIDKLKQEGKREIKSNAC